VPPSIGLPLRRTSSSFGPIFLAAYVTRSTIVEFATVGASCRFSAVAPFRASRIRHDVRPIDKTASRGRSSSVRSVVMRSSIVDEPAVTTVAVVSRRQSTRARWSGRVAHQPSLVISCMDTSSPPSHKIMRYCDLVDNATERSRDEYEATGSAELDN
jgi:hypothetical protein